MQQELISPLSPASPTLPEDLHLRSIQQFAQLILLLVNIVQGISLSVLAQKVVDLKISSIADYSIYLRIVASLIMIWFVTFQYAVVVVTLWFASNGIRDILFILIFGIAEYGAMYSVPDADKWLLWVTAMTAFGVPCFLSTNAHAAKMIKKLPHPTLIETKRKTIQNLVNVFICGAVLLGLCTTQYTLPNVWTYMKRNYMDYIIPLFITVYSVCILWRDSRFIDRVVIPSQKSAVRDDPDPLRGGV